MSGSERVTREALLDLLRGDRELFEMLQEVGIIPERDLAPVEVEEVYWLRERWFASSTSIWLA